MEKSLSEHILDADLIIVAVGNEWNWIRKGLKNDKRYQELLSFCENEENEWLLPVVEFEYAFYNNDPSIDEAYKKLRKMIGQKSYFLISELFLQDALLNGFEEDKTVYPCGNYRYLQTNNPEDELIKATDSEDFMELVGQIHGIIEEKHGSLYEGETFYKPFFHGKELYLNQKRLEYSKIIYRESAYLPNWDMYTRYLTGTLNHRLLMLELGVSLDYPTVIRWPFEKVTFFNKEAHLIRVHEKLYHHTPEIKEKTDSVAMNSVEYIMQESEGL